MSTKKLFCIPQASNEVQETSGRSERPAVNGVWDVSGTGPPGPAGATAPARRKARSQASGASARRLREMNRVLAPGA